MSNLGMRTVLLTLAVCASLSPFAGAARTGQTPQAEEGTVIARAADWLPRRSAAWRVVHRVSPQIGNERAFILAIPNPLVVTWPDGERTSLGVGDAAYAGSTFLAKVEPVAADPLEFLAIELVPAAFATGPTAAQIDFVADEFVTPPGRRELELRQQTIAPDAVAYVDPDDGNALLYVLEGTVEVRYGRGDEEVGAGSAASINDNAAVVATGGETATYLVTHVGDEVPSPAGATATSGEIGVAIYDCPAGMRPDTLDPAICPYTTGPVIDLRLKRFEAGSETQLALRDAQLVDELYVWDRLPFGEYILQAKELGPGYDRFLIPGLTGLNTRPELGYTISPNEGYLLTLDAEQPIFELPVYVFRPA
ncbi:MAG: cupin domain-containing protein [Chloroflexota bacterium]|nr:cupin domain-containing protein [Chloroflexota bacterium]